MSDEQHLRGDPINTEPSEQARLTVLVVDKSGASAYRVSDPRTHLEERPWMGRGAGEA
jgi:hypothetical protein